MKLTNYMRDAFVRAAMLDVPAIQYDDKIRALAMKTALAQLPAKVAAIYNDPKTREHIETTWVNLKGACITLSVPGACGDGTHRTGVEAACKALVEADAAQKEARGSLERRLRAVAYGVTTRKALVDALPEFEKYLPADEPAAIKTLPVIANVVSDFVKAGWPKGKKPAKVAA